MPDNNVDPLLNQLEEVKQLYGELVTLRQGSPSVSRQVQPAQQQLLPRANYTPEQIWEEDRIGGPEPALSSRHYASAQPWPILHNLLHDLERKVHDEQGDLTFEDLKSLFEQEKAVLQQKLHHQIKYYPYSTALQFTNLEKKRYDQIIELLERKL